MRDSRLIPATGDWSSASLVNLPGRQRSQEKTGRLSRRSWYWPPGRKSCCCSFVSPLGRRVGTSPFFLLDWAPMRAKELLWLSDWLNELAVFGNPKHFYDSETATHCAQVLKYRHLVVIAIEPLAGNKKGDAGVFYGQ